MPIEFENAVSYNTVNIRYERPADAPAFFKNDDIISCSTIAVIHKDNMRYITYGYSRVIIGPLTKKQIASYRSTTLNDHIPIEYSLFLVSKSNVHFNLESMYCIGEYMGTDHMANYLVFCDKYPNDDTEKRKMLSFNH